ncbi:MAG: aspartate-semialdehyde dehydrogenase [Pseudomonadota bacterium]
MRGLVLGAAVLALAACGSGTDSEPVDEAVATPPPVPSDPATDEATVTPTPEPTPDPVVMLDGGSIAAGSEKLLFNAGRTETDAALAKVLGDATGSSANDECGAGPLEFTDFPGGFSVSYQGGKLVGWLWRLPQDGDNGANAEIKTSVGVSLGTPRATVEGKPGFEMFEESTLGDEYAIGSDLFGFFDKGEVSMLYAGTQCFFR